MSFAVKFSPFLASAGSTGTYGLEGEFSNTEPSKDAAGNPYQFSDISTGGNYYFIDAEGNIFPIVYKTESGPNGFPYIEMDNLFEETYTPQVAIGAITMINPETMQFYSTSVLNLPLRTKIQRINVRDLVIAAGGTGENIYNIDGTLDQHRILFLNDYSLTFRDGDNEAIFDKDKLHLRDMDLELNQVIIQESDDGTRWSYATTDIGSTVKTQLP